MMFSAYQLRLQTLVLLTGLCAPSANVIGALQWDSTRKEVNTPAGAPNAIVRFTVTNTLQSPITIDRYKPSCGCSIAEGPVLPWKLQPGQHGALAVTTDLRHKRGSLHKTLTVNSSAGIQVLHFTIHIGREAIGDERTRNQRLAKTDPQAIFRNDCAQCHAEPAKGKLGKELYTAACGICHEAEHRASMVPDLRKIPLPQHLPQWLHLISTGKANTLMPAFYEKHGGPLTAQQVRSLAQFMHADFPKQKQRVQQSHLKSR